jgi:hypothetical protein
MTKNITVNISLAGEIGMDKIRQEFDKAVRAEIDRVGVNVDFDAKKKTLKVGDYAKVINEDGHPFKTGELVEVTHVDINDTYMSYCVSNSVESSWMMNSQITRATDEEVAEAKREYANQQAEKELADKWAKIGRKPNEFKEGDIIGFKFLHEPLLAYEAKRIDGKELWYYDAEEKREMFLASDSDSVSLVTPVEHRFDLAEGDSE